MAKNKEDAVAAVTAYLEKAIRRGEKLEKTLLKVVARSEPQSHAEELLNALQKGLKRLEQQLDDMASSESATAKVGKRTKKASAEKADLAHSHPVARRTANGRKTKKADIGTLA